MIPFLSRKEKIINVLSYIAKISEEESSALKYEIYCVKAQEYLRIVMSKNNEEYRLKEILIEALLE